MYRFAGHEVDVAQRRVTALPGTHVALPSRAFDVLAYLLEHRARAVGKDELMRAVWPQSVVEENNLSQAVSALRRALGHAPGTSRFVATVPGRGFQFVAPLDYAPPVSSPHALAILPLRPLHAASADAALELGMTEALINRCSAIPGVRVLPLSSVQRYAQRDVDPVVTGRTLGADSILEGRLQADSGRVRLTARLVDTADGTGRWNGVFDTARHDLLSAQDALAERVAEALQPGLTEAERGTLLQRPTADDEAWRLYLHGRFHWERKSSFAPPRVGLADACTTQAVFNVRPPRAAFDEARAEARRALELDPSFAEAYAALGHIVAQCDRDWDEATRLQEEALRRKPGYGHAVMWRAMLRAYRGDVLAALEQIKRAQALEPMSLSFSAIAGMLMYFARAFEASARHLKGIVDTVPDASLARYLYARSLLALGDADAVVALLAGRNVPGPWAMSTLARAHALAGRAHEARARAAQVRELGARGFGVGVDLALIHVALGEHDVALDWLERAVDDVSQTMGYLNLEPAFDPIREAPRFREVSRRVGLG